MFLVRRFCPVLRILIAYREVNNRSRLLVFAWGGRKASGLLILEVTGLGGLLAKLHLNSIKKKSLSGINIVEIPSYLKYCVFPTDPYRRLDQ